ADVERGRHDRTRNLEVAHLEHHRRVGPDLLGRVHVGQFAPDHQARHLVLGGGADVLGGDVMPVAQDGDTVGDGHDLVELVGDVDDGHAFGRQATDEAEQDLGLGAGEDVGRFVHEPHVYLAGDGHVDVD